MQEIKMLLPYTDTFVLPDAIMPPLHIINFAKALKENNINIKYTCLTRPDYINDQTAKALKESGCIQVTIGTETASNLLLSLVDKKTNIERSKQALEISKKYGLRLDLFIMIFLPGETKDTLKENLQFIKSVNANVGTEICTPIPGTTLWKKALADGELKTGEWPEVLEKTGTIGNNFKREEVIRLKGWFLREIAKEMAKKRPMDVIERIVHDPRKIVTYTKFWLQHETI